MGWELKRHDRAAVLDALRKGEYEAIATSGQGALDALLHLAIELGVFEALQVIKVERERAGIPDELLLRVLAVLPFVEAIGLCAAAGRLMADAAILLEPGFSIAEMQDGFNERHVTESPPPGAALQHRALPPSRQSSAPVSGYGSAGPVSAFVISSIPSKRLLWHSRAASTRSRMLADGSPVRSLVSLS